MSEIKALEQKIDNSNGKIDQLIETMTTFIAFQARAEERQNSDREEQRRVERYQEKQDEKIEVAQATANDAKNQAFSNGKWINMGVAILTAVLIYIGKLIIDGRV